MAGQTSDDAWRALLLSRAVVWIAGVAAVAVAGTIGDNGERFDPDGLTRPFGSPGDELVAPGARWDAMWFLRIAEDGYDGDPDRAAFFPLYPLLVRVLAVVVRSEVVAGILLSLACTFGALVLLRRLVALDFSADVARLTVLLVAVFPGALWLSSVYSEALFLLLSVAAVWWARTDRWALAGVAGFLAATTRSAGVVLVVPLALIWWRSGRPVRDLAWTLLVPAGVLAFCAYTAAVGLGFGAPLDAQEAWSRSFAGPLGAVPAGVADGWEGLTSLLAGEAQTFAPYDPRWVNLGLLGTLAAVLALLVVAVRRVPLAYSGYAAAALLLPLSYPVEGQALMSLPRFASVLWPLMLGAAVVLAPRPRARAVAVGLCLVGLAVVSWHVARWGWVA